MRPGCQNSLLARHLQQSLYHYMWFRDNCNCVSCGTHASRSRFQALLDISDNIMAINLRADRSGLTIAWVNDGRVSRFDLSWLRDSCYSATERGRRSRRKILWDHSIADMPTVDYRTGAGRWRRTLQVILERSRLRLLFFSSHTVSAVHRRFANRKVPVEAVFRLEWVVFAGSELQEG